MLKRRDLIKLPFTTLSQLAMALARDIDAGDDDKRNALDLIFDVLAKGI
jgi:hypothetical protein